MEASQLALQAGFPTEGIQIIEAGNKAGALGVGTDAPRHKRLRDLADLKFTEIQKKYSDGRSRGKECSVMVMDS